MEKIIVKNGQSILDVCLRAYGTLENLYDLLNDNNLNINSNISSGDELTINTDIEGDVKVKKELKRLNFNIVNQSEEDLETLEGDFNNDFNNDFDI